MSFQWTIKAGILPLLAAGLILSGCGVAPAAQSAPVTVTAEATSCNCTELTGKVTYSYQKVAEFALPDLVEPAGMAFHPARKSLFIAGQQGQILEIDAAGQPVQQKRVGAEGEVAGLAYHPSRDLLYLVPAAGSSILEINPTNLAVQREIELAKVWGDQPRPSRLEGATLVPGTDPSGAAVLYLAAQEGPARALLLALEIEAQPAPRLIHHFSINVRNLAGLAYEPASHSLLASSTSSTLLFGFDLSGQGLKAQALPGQEPLALTLDDSGQFLYVSEAAGRVVKYEVVQ